MSPVDLFDQVIQLAEHSLSILDNPPLPLPKQDNTLYQDLVSDPPGGVVINTTAVAEPSGAVLSSISVLFFAVLHWWRRIA